MLEGKMKVFYGGMSLLKWPDLGVALCHSGEGVSITKRCALCVEEQGASDISPLHYSII
jgi:hypothetical protein